MNEQQYKQFQEEKAHLSAVGLEHLANKAPRTLLYGYNTDRSTFHVYIDPTDGLIHVLTYVSAGRIGDERHFVLRHTKGTTGGVSRSEDYVPNKRLYPESCDLEFCRLLRDADVSLPFTTFDANGLTRVERHNGFAGHIHHEGMVQAVDLKKQMAVDFNIFAEPTMEEHLVRTACYDLGVPFTSVGYPEVTMVAEHDVEKVQAKVLDYLKTMSPAATRTVEDIENDISETSVAWSHSTVVENHYPDRFGAYAIRVDYRDAPVLVGGSDTTQYDGADGLRALKGTYEGHPYFVILRGGTVGLILVHLVGPSEQFVAETMKFHKMVPRTVAA